MTYTTRRSASLARPPIDLRSLLPPIRNQRARPLCAPFAVAAAHEAARAAIIASSRPEQLAIEPLWRHCVIAGTAGPAGTRLTDVGDALSSGGHPTETAWPYNASLGHATEPPPPSAAATRWFAADLIKIPLRHDGLEDLIEDALALLIPVVIVIELTTEFERPQPSGEIAVPTLTSSVGDYHAVLAVGAATDSTQNSRQLLVRNSWGAGWGAGGYGWLPHDYLIAFAVQAGIINPSTCR